MFSDESKQLSSKIDMTQKKNHVRGSLERDIYSRKKKLRTLFGSISFQLVKKEKRNAIT